MRVSYDLSDGVQVGHLVVDGEPYFIYRNGVNKRYHDVRCLLCGNMRPRRAEDLRKAIRLGADANCGCRSSSYRHGLEGTPLYKVWGSMLNRCRNPKCDGYQNYGGRGIRVCDEWQNFATFYAWAGSRYVRGLQIDRIDNDGNYEPSNCRFVTQTENNRNKRRSGEAVGVAVAA